jgi:hypothetical protein
MIIKFTQDTELTIITGYDEENDNITDEITEFFKAGQCGYADIVSEDGNFVDLEFDHGVAFGVNRDCFEVIIDDAA